MATPLHPLQAPQSYEESAPPPPQSYGIPTAYGAPPAGYGAGGATPGYAYGTVQGTVPPSTSGGCPSDAVSGIQGSAFGAPNAASYMLETGGAVSKLSASYSPAGYPSSGIAAYPVVAAATASIATTGGTTPVQVDPRDQIETNRWAAGLCSCCSICVPNCLMSCCCSCCAIAQMATHIKSYRPGSCGFEGPNVLPAYAR